MIEDAPPLHRSISLLDLGRPLAEGSKTAGLRSEVNLVNISEVVRSSGGKLLGNLSRDDFDVVEDGVPQTIKILRPRGRA